MTEDVEPLPTGAPAGHEIKSIKKMEDRTKIKCQCGAVWTVPNATYDRGITYVNDHWHYANKKFTQAD